jgi:site-specific recombinase XerD
VKGVKKIGVRLGNWLTAEQSQNLWQAPGGERLKEKRDRALLAVLLACGLRRHEAVELNFGHRPESTSTSAKQSAPMLYRVQRKDTDPQTLSLGP